MCYFFTISQNLLKFEEIGCMYAETFGCMYAPFGCMSMERLGAKYAVVGCMYAETPWVHVCGFWVHL